MTTFAREREAGRDAGPATGVTAGELCLTFVPFGLGLVAAIWYAELSQDLRLFRTIYAITDTGRQELGVLRDEALREVQLRPDPVDLALQYSAEIGLMQVIPSRMRALDSRLMS